MKLQERYDWEAIRADGSVFVKGADLSDVVKFSFVPQGSTLLPRHDLVGIKMKNRFCRGFIQVMGGGMRDYFHCIVCEEFRLYLSSLTGAILITPKDFELYI